MKRTNSGGFFSLRSSNKFLFKPVSLPVKLITLVCLLLSNFAVFAQVSNFSYTGAQQSWTAPSTGWYRLETWGAQGGSGESYTVSRGGYASGEVYVTSGTTLYIYVGGQGVYRTYGGETHSTAVNTNGGWNGGGGVYNSAASHGSGGGATDIALTAGATTLTDYTYRRTNASYLSRIIVAGGGAGNGNWQNGLHSGGGAEGLGMPGHFGTQTGTSTSASAAGAFGYGGRGQGGSGGGNGGGGGWYGGGGAQGGSAGGGGGSGYVLTSSSHKPSGYTPTSAYYLSNTILTPGNQVMPNPSGGSMTGKSGDGYARISKICGSINGPSALYIGTSATFTAETTGGTWSSSTTAVATVDASTGAVTAVANGYSLLSYTVSGSCQSTMLVRVYSAASDFTYTATEQNFVVPVTGRYKIEAWGAQGGTGESYNISRGGYASGEVLLTAGTTLFVYVGGQGNYKTYGTNTHSTAVNTNGGWNGGGGVSNSAASHGTGGGGSDICLVRSDVSLANLAFIRNVASYNSRILVAGGGAGNGNWQTGVYSGGGTTGVGPSGQVGTQTSSSTTAAFQGSFGYGGRGQGSSGGGNGGGGGWYGGGGAQGGTAGGGGGSAYVLTASSHIPSGYSVGSSYYFSNTSMIAGNASMPNPAGGTMTGRNGHGMVRFTFLCPVAGVLSGSQDVPMGQTTTFTTDGSTGGSWSTSDATIATVNASTGEITGVRNGTATITYTISASGGCGVSTATRTVNVICTQATAPSGIGTTADPYQVSSFAHLLWIAADNTRWNKHYIQTTDIDASGSNCLGGGDGWLPIGDNTVGFTGSYNGQGHSITGIYSNRGAQTAITALGLFGETVGAQVSNLHVLNSNITGSESVGAVIGYSRGNTIVTNVHSSGIIRSAGTTGIAGGVIGWLTTGSLSQSSSTATVSVAAVGGRVGGIAGYSKQTTITRSFAHGNISSSGSDGSIGGLVGDALNTTITECYALGTLTNNGTVLNLGGLLGTQMGGAINNSYAAVAINSATGTKGGLVAQKVSGAINNSYYDTEVSQQTGNTNGNALTTAQLKSYTSMIPNGWDMQCERINGNADTWGMNAVENNGYPFLSWEARVAQCPEWTGQASSSFTSPANWLNGLMPLSGMDIVFNGSASNDLVLTQHWITGRIVFSGSGQKLELDNYNLTMLGNGIDANANNYVKTSGSGRMVATIQNGEEFLFPVGFSSYNPITIKNNTGNADIFSVFIGDEVLENGSGGAALSYARVERTWDIHKANPNGGDGIDITLGWSSNDQSAAITTPWLYHYERGKWNKLFGEQTSTPNSLVYKNYKGNFSPFAVLEASFILPVTWLNFTATKQQDNVLLKWATASEQNTRDYIIQHSLNGIDWANAGNVTAAGNSSSVRNYHWLHVKPAAGTQYYRILQRDLDGKESYSRIVAVQFTSGNSLNIYPNPSADGFVKMQLPQAATVRLYNLNGAEVWQKTLQAGLHTIDLSRQPKGVYLIKVNDQSSSIVLQ